MALGQLACPAPAYVWLSFCTCLFVHHGALNLNFSLITPALGRDLPSFMPHDREPLVTRFGDGCSVSDLGLRDLRCDARFFLALPI